MNLSVPIAKVPSIGQNKSAIIWALLFIEEIFKCRFYIKKQSK